MILAEKIIKLRKQMGWSQEDLAMQLGVSRQSVSKWESMASIPDLDKIIKLSQLFGVSTDYLLKDEIEEAETEAAGDPPHDDENVHVSIEEANRYMDAAEKAAGRIASGVAACIFSPVTVILLTGYAETGIFNMSEEAAAGIGSAVLLTLIAVAVMLFITAGMKMSKFEYLEEELLDLEYGVAGIVETKKEQNADNRKRAVAAGVGLCIFSVVPILLTAAFTEKDSAFITMTALLLTLIAAGVFLIVYTEVKNSPYEKLLEEGDFTREKKINKKKNSNISTVYWCVALAVYLGWSFITMDWHITWVVWPVAGVLFGAVIAIANMIRK